MGNKAIRDPFLSVSLPGEKKEALKELAAKKGLKPVAFVRQMIYAELEKAA